MGRSASRWIRQLLCLPQIPASDRLEADKTEQKALSSTSSSASNGHFIRKPDFDALPLHPDHPKCSAWGLWGSQDELGTLNLITSDVVTASKHEIRTGEVISLK